MFILIYVLATVFFLPGSVLTLAGGALFGSVIGVFYNLMAATIGAILSFLAAHYLASNWVEKISGMFKTTGADHSFRDLYSEEIIESSVEFINSTQKILIMRYIAMALSDDPKKYNDWYYSKQGIWLGHLEYSILSRLMQVNNNATLLDIGCGTGYFSRQFSHDGLNVTAIDPASSMIEFAMTQNGDVRYIIGNALTLPCTDNEFDYCSAITSLCFINEPRKALSEMWRVSKKGLILGLLNRHSLLYLQKSGRGSYAGVRWDSTSDVIRWIASLKPEPSGVEFKSVFFLPGFGILSKKMETFFGSNLKLGGFLAVSIQH